MSIATKSSANCRNTVIQQHKTIKLGIIGLGRMGSELVRCIEQQDNIKLVAVATRNSAQKNNSGLAAELNLRYGSSLMITDSISDVFDATDIVIDFSSNAALQQCLICADRIHKPLVSGTTGLSKETKEMLKQAATKIPLLWTPNSTPGINIILQILQCQKMLSANYDVEILDIHHKHKKDSPSGTSLLLAESINSNNPEKTINFSSMRCGNVPGKHSVIFANHEEIITISHEPVNRSVFALNAIKAAQWLLMQQKPGLYTMNDVLAI